MTVKEQLLVALRDAGRRGLTRRECVDVAGPHFNRRLLELEDDGHLLHRRRGRYGSSWFRVILTLEAVPAVPEPEQPPLMACSGAAAPRNAILEDVAA